MPTRDRCEAVVRNVRRLLDDPLIGEVIVIVDGCTDATEHALREVGAPDRLRVLVHPVSLGPEVSRNDGAALARFPWIAFLDDDDEFPPDFFQQLLRAASSADADLVSPRWIHRTRAASPPTGWRRRAKALLDRAADGPDPFPAVGCRESIWINSNYLVRRAYAQRARYNEALTGSYWRDETDVAVSVARLGGRVLVTGDTFSYMTTRETGGIDRQNRLRYEASILRNEVRFLMRHGQWLKEHRYIKGVASRLAQSVLQRVMAAVRDVAARVGGF